jgi:hypothetical protein
MKRFINHIYTTQKEKIPCSKRTLSRYIDLEVVTVLECPALLINVLSGTPTIIVL